MNRQEFEEYVKQGGKPFVVNTDRDADDHKDCFVLHKGEVVELKQDEGDNTPTFYFPNREKRANYSNRDIHLSKLDPYTAPIQTHYDTLHQPTETMQANMTPEAFRGYLRGNIIKYTCRMGRKDGEAELKEAKKILDYAKWLVESLEGKTIDPRKVGK